MRFKAKLAPEQLTLFYNAVSPMARIASTSTASSAGGGGTHRGGEPASTSAWTRNGCILHLDAGYARLYCRGKSMETDQIQCYAEFEARGTSALFVDYRIESAAEGNAICMEVDLAQLRLALQSLAQDKKQQHNQSMSMSSFGVDPYYQSTVLKLAKRNNVPCLCLDAFTTSGEGGGGGGMPIQVHHSISVRILRLADMVHFRPPQFDRLRTADVVQLELPSDRPIRTVMEGLRALASGSGGSHSSSSMSNAAAVTLRATSSGELTISLDSDGAAIRAYFHRLPTVADDEHDSDGDQVENRRDRPLDSASARGQHGSGAAAGSHRKRVARVRVDAKKLCSCLQWQQNASFPVHRAVLCLVENEVLLVHVDLHPPGVGHQTYYVPVRYMSPDDDEEEDGDGGPQ
jgi:Hus1-like protein